MCEVTTLMAAGAVTSALGAYTGGQAEAASLSFQRQVSLANAARTREATLDAADRGADREQQVRADGTRIIGGQRAGFASNNMDLSFGSPLDTIVGTAIEVERDAYRVRQNTSREVEDLRTRETNFRNNAAAQEAGAANARSAGFVAGVGTALNGGAAIARHRASIE